MATLAEKRAYARKLIELSRRFDKLEDDTIRAMVQLMLDAQKAIGGRMAYELTVGNNPTAAILSNIISDINPIIDSLNNQLIRTATGSINRAAIDGQEFVIEPLAAGGVDTFTLNIRPSIPQINILTDFTADLITQTTEEMRRQIVGEIRLAALSGRSPLQSMQRITQIIGINGRKQIVGGVTAKAERIFRTEINRAYNIATFSQQQDAAAQIPGIQKQWMATGDTRTRRDHLNAHGQTVDVNDKFIVGGEEMDYPLDPSASAKQTVNCRCRPITVHPDIETPVTTVDKQVQAERQRRKDENDQGIDNKIDKLPLFHNVKDAELWAKSKGVDASYVGLNTEQAQAINKSIYRLQNRNIESPSYIRTVATDETFVARASGGGRGIEINPKYFNKDYLDSTRINSYTEKLNSAKTLLDSGTITDEFEIESLNKRIARYEKNITKPRWGAPDTLDEIIDHEMGHVIHTDLSTGRYENINDFIAPSALRQKGIDYTKTLGARIDQIAQEEGGKISEYATTKGEEYIAESFVLYLRGQTKDINKELLDIFRQVIDGN